MSYMCVCVCVCIYIYIYIYMGHLFLMFLDHTQRRSTVGRTPLDEWSARHRDLYLKTHDTHNRQISILPVEEEMVEEQCVSRKGRSSTDAIFTVQQVIEKRKEHNLPLFLLFIDYEKAYDNVNRDKLWEMMENKIPNYLLNIIKCIYRNTNVRIKFNGSIS